MKPKRVWTDLKVEEVSLVSAPANKPALVTLFKSAQKADKPTCRGCGTSVAASDKYCKNCGAPFYKAAPTEDSMTDEQKAAEAAKQAAEQKVADEKAAEIAKAAEVAKANAAALEKERAEKADLEKKNADLSERIAKLEKDGRIAATKGRVAKSMKAVPVEASELADKLVALAEKDADLATYVETVLGKCSELIAKGELLAQKSKGIENGSAGSTVEQKVDALVAKKLAEDPKLTKAQAERAVWRENAGLYAEYEQERAQA